MTKEEKFLVINDLIKTTFSAHDFRNFLERSLIRTVCKEDEKDLYKYFRIILDFLQTNSFIQESNAGNRIKFTKEWENLRESGSIEKYLSIISEKEKNEANLKERNQKISEESLQLSKDANKISEDANGISKKAKNISFWSFIVAILSTFIAAGALVYSIFNGDSKEIKELNKKIDSIEYDNTLIKERHLEEHKEYVRHIDSLYIEINKLKNK